MRKLLLSVLFLVGLADPAAAALKVFACEPEWAALAQELGGERLTAYSATTAYQDPHHIEARPSLIARLRQADLVVCTGAELEIGWLPALLRQAGNARVQPGRAGYFEAATVVERLDVPMVVDRAMGDVHPSGNPHIQTDPRNIARVAGVLTRRVAEIDPANAVYYQSRYRDFAKRWEAAIRRWEQEAAPLRGVAIVVHHKTFAYLENWLSLRELAQLEPKPGVEPTSAHLVAVLDKLRREPAKMILRTPYQSPRGSDWLSDRAKIPVIVIPDTVGGSDRAQDLFGLFDDIVHRLLGALK